MWSVQAQLRWEKNVMFLGKMALPPILLLTAGSKIERRDNIWNSDNIGNGRELDSGEQLIQNTTVTADNALALWRIRSTWMSITSALRFPGKYGRAVQGVGFQGKLLVPVTQIRPVWRLFPAQKTAIYYIPYCLWVYDLHEQPEYWCQRWCSWRAVAVGDAVGVLRQIEYICWRKRGSPPWVQIVGVLC